HRTWSRPGRPAGGRRIPAASMPPPASAAVPPAPGRECPADPVAVLGGRPAPPTGGEVALPRSRPRRVQRLETLLALRSPPRRSRGGTAGGARPATAPAPCGAPFSSAAPRPAAHPVASRRERGGAARLRAVEAAEGARGGSRRLPGRVRPGAGPAAGSGGQENRGRGGARPRGGRGGAHRARGSPAGPVPFGRWRPPLSGAARHGACTRAGGSRITAPARGNVTRGPSGGSGRAPAARRRGVQPQVATAIRGGRPAGKGVRRRSPHRERPNVDARGRPLLHCPVITVRQTRLIGRGHSEARPPTGGGPRPPGAGLFAFGTAPARTERRRTVRHPVRDSRLHAHTTAVPG